jgi:hypothetical protein
MLRIVQAIPYSKKNSELRNIPKGNNFFFIFLGLLTFQLSQVCPLPPLIVPGRQFWQVMVEVFKNCPFPQVKSFEEKKKKKAEKGS